MHDRAMLDRYDFRRSQGWGPERIAKGIAEDNAKINEANKTLPRGQRKRGLCSGSTTVKTIERRLNRVLSARREIAEHYALKRQQLKEGSLLRRQEMPARGCRASSRELAGGTDKFTLQYQY
jgi:hypothetical protein